MKQVRTASLIAAAMVVLTTPAGADSKRSGSADMIFPVSDGGRSGFVDANGDMIVPLIYDEASGFESGPATVRLDGKFGLVDRTGKAIVAPRYENIARSFDDGLIWIVENGMYGYLDTKGRVVIPPQFELARAFSDGYAKVTAEGKERYIDRKGRLQPDGFAPPPRKEDKTWFLSRKADNGRYGLVRKDKTEIAPPRYARAQRSSREGRLAVWNDAGSCGYVDDRGKERIKLRYQDCGYFEHGLAAVKRNGKWGVVDRSGKVIIGFRFEEVGMFDRLGGAAARDSGAWGLIDRKGRWTIPPTLTEKPEFRGRHHTQIHTRVGRARQSRLLHRNGHVLWESSTPSSEMAMDQVRSLAMAWERHRGNAAGRARALPHVHAAVRAFFFFELGLVIRKLVEAELALETPAPIEPAALAARMLFVTAPVIVDPRGAPALIHLHPFHRGAAEAGLSVSWELRDQAGATVAGGALPITVPLGTGQVAVATLADGDYRLVSKVISNGRTIREMSAPISVIAGATARLEALAQRIDATKPRDIEKVSLVHRFRLLEKALRSDRPLPDGVEPVRLLGEIEESLARIDAGARAWKETPGEHVLAAWHADAIVPLRLFVPERRLPRAPLVIALHGNGVSEHWWFDHYGNGALIEEARRRGWYVLAVATETKDPVTAALWAAQRLIAYDPARVYLVGHSFGGGRALEAAAATPALFAGVAAFAPGPKATAGFPAKMPVFIARGALEHRWIVESTAGTKKAFEDAGATRLRYQEVPGAEHFLIVGAALGDALAHIAER